MGGIACSKIRDRRRLRNRVFFRPKCAASDFCSTYSNRDSQVVNVRIGKNQPKSTAVVPEMGRLTTSSKKSFISIITVDLSFGVVSDETP